MSLTKFLKNKDEFYRKISFLSNALLVIAAMLVASYLVAPLLGGKLSVYAIIAYASWIGIALVSKLFLRRVRKGLRVRVFEYLLLCLCVIVNLAVWFRYPINVILSILSIAGCVFAYRAQDKPQTE
jgi:hypothetical protein